jgi:transposase
MMIYHGDPNTVEPVPFELLKAMPDTTPASERLTPEMLRRLAQANQRATLNDLAYAVQDELGVRPSITHMSRLLSRVGLNSKARRQLNDASKNTALYLAA